MRQRGACGLEEIGWSSWGRLRGLNIMGEGGAPRLGARRYRPCRSPVRSRVGALSPVAGRLGRPQSPCAAPERETEALRAGAVVGSLPRRVAGWGRGRRYYAAHVGSGPGGAHVRCPRLPESASWARGSLSSSLSLSVITQRRGRCGVRSRRLRLRRLPSAGRVSSERPRYRPRRRRGWRRRSPERPLWPAIQAVRKQSGCLW